MTGLILHATALCICSVWVAGVDVLEMTLSVGKTFISLNNNQSAASTLSASASNPQPTLANAWFDIDVSLYGTTFATDQLTLPGMHLGSCVGGRAGHAFRVKIYGLPRKQAYYAHRFLGGQG